MARSFYNYLQSNIFPKVQLGYDVKESAEVVIIFGSAHISNPYVFCYMIIRNFKY